MSETNYRNIRLTEEAYQHLERRKQPGESFSDTVERIAGERSWLELAGIISDDEAETMIQDTEERDEQARDRLDELTDMMDS